MDPASQAHHGVLVLRLDVMKVIVLETTPPPGPDTASRTMPSFVFIDSEVSKLQARVLTSLAMISEVPRSIFL